MGTSRLEALLGLVPGSVFKTDDALREQRYGGFDSRALPPFSPSSCQANPRLASEAGRHLWIDVTTQPDPEPVASMSDRMVAAMVIADGRLAWSSHMFDAALAKTAEAAASAPEALLRSAWHLLADRDLDVNVYQFCRALGAAALGGYRRTAGWDLTWMLDSAGPAQLCLRYWSLALRPELWDEATERETLIVLRAYPFAW